MSQFINPEDYDASIHREILDALIREDESLLEVCEDQAIAEMRGYLSSRFDCDKIFAATGSERHPLVLMYAKDITLYHVFCIHNPQKISKIRIDRYERSLEWLKGVSRFEISVEGLPAKEDADTRNASPFQMRSNPKRVTRY